MKRRPKSGRFSSNGRIGLRGANSETGKLWFAFLNKTFTLVRVAKTHGETGPNGGDHTVKAANTANRGDRDDLAEGNTAQAKQPRAVFFCISIVP